MTFVQLQGFCSWLFIVETWRQQWYCWVLYAKHLLYMHVSKLSCYGKSFGIQDGLIWLVGCNWTANFKGRVLWSFKWLQCSRALGDSGQCSRIKHVCMPPVAVCGLCGLRGFNTEHQTAFLVLQPLLSVMQLQRQPIIPISHPLICSVMTWLSASHSVFNPLVWWAVSRSWQRASQHPLPSSVATWPSVATCWHQYKLVELLERLGLTVF